MDEKLLDGFKHKEKYFFKIFYKPDKTFKHIPSGEYLTISLRTPYQYIVVMLCRLYGDQEASVFTLSLISLTH